MAGEVDLTVKATADTAAAKAAVADLNAEVGKSAIVQDEVAVSTAAATTAIDEATAADYRREAVLEAQAVLLATVTEAQDAAALAVANMATAAESGGAKYKVAIAAAATATAQLEIAIDAVRASGGPVSTGTVAQLEAYDAAVQAATLATAKLTTNSTALNIESQLLKGNVGGLGRALALSAGDAGSLAGAFASLALPVGAAIGIMALLPQIVEKIGAGYSALTTALGAFLSGLENTTGAVDSHGKALGVLTDEYQRALDEQALVTRAQAAMDAGVIQVTTDLKLATAELVLHNAAMHGWSVVNDEVLASMKELGLKVPETFEHIKASAQGFIDEYTLKLKTEGPAAARIFAEENKARLDQIETRFEKLGQQVPPQLKAIADSIGLVSAQEKHLAEQDDLTKKYEKTIDDTKEKLAELSKALVDNAKAYADHSTKIEQDRQAQVAAIDSTTAKTIADLQQQVKETQDAHDKRAISDTEYNTKINTLIADEAKAKDAAYEASQKIDQSAQKDQTALTTKYQEETKKRKEAIEDAAATEADAQKRLDALNVARNEENRALSEAAPLWKASAEFAKLLSDTYTPLAEKAGKTAASTFDLAHSMEEASKSSGSLLPGLDLLIDRYNDLAVAAKVAAAAVASVTDGPGVVAGAAEPGS